MSDPVEERLTELEVRVSYQDDLIAQLDGVIRDLGDQLVVVRRELADLQAHPLATDPEGEGGGGGFTSGS